MRIRVESPFSISAGPFKPMRTRRVAAVGHTVHWYQIGYRDLDAFLREIYRHYASNYRRVIHEHVQYQWYASLTLYYRGSTIALNLSYSRLYDCNDYRLQYRQELDAEIGFLPKSIEFWQLDSSRNSRLFADIREILNEMVKGVTK